MRHELHVARAAYQAAEAELQRLRLEKARVEVEVEALRSDPDVIERRAREELNMVRPDELVFSFPDQTQKEKSKDGSQTNSTNTR
jgi:cell division protein FtsB